MDPNVLFETLRLMGMPSAIFTLLLWQFWSQYNRRREIVGLLEDRRRMEYERVKHWREQYERLMKSSAELHDVVAKVPRRPRPSDNMDAQRTRAQMPPPARRVDIPGMDGEPIALIVPSGRQVDDLGDYGRMPSQGKVRGGTRPPLHVRWDNREGRRICDEWLRQNPPEPPPVPDFDFNTDVRFKPADGPQSPNDPGAELYEWIEVTAFGSADQQWVRGRRIGKHSGQTVPSNVIPPPGPPSYILKSTTPHAAPTETRKRPAPSFRPNHRLSNPTLM